MFREAPPLKPGSVVAAAALAAGGAAYFWNPSGGLSGPPEQCPGLAELSAVLWAAAGPATPLAPILAGADRVVAALMAGLMLWAAARVSGSVAIGAGVAIAVAGTSAVASVPPLALVLPCVALVTTALMSGARSRATDRAMLALFPLTAVLAPQALVPVVLAAIVWTRSSNAIDGSTNRRAPLVGAGCVLAVALVSWLVPGPSAAGCLLPLASEAERTTTIASINATLGSGGFYLAALAVLAGVAATSARVSAPRLALSAYLAGVILADVRSTTTPLPTLIAALGLAAAAGLRQLSGAASGRVWQPVAAAFFIAVLPAAALVRAFSDAAPRSIAPETGSRSSLAAIARTVEQAPEGARLVDEDALTDVLLRAANFRGHQVPPGIASSPAEVRRAASAGPVVALPLAQEWLENRGFELRDMGGVPGLALVEPRGLCRPLLPSWRRITDLESGETFALVARAGTDVGPVRIYAIFDVEPKLYSLDWPADVLHLFRWKLYAPGDAALRADLANDEVTTDAATSDASYALRLDQGRTPGAPLALATTFHARPRAVFAKLIDPSAGGISLCPAFPHDPRPIAVP